MCHISEAIQLACIFIKDVQSLLTLSSQGSLSFNAQNFRESTDEADSKKTRITLLLLFLPSTSVKSWSKVSGAW